MGFGKRAAFFLAMVGVACLALFGSTLIYQQYISPAEVQKEGPSVDDLPRTSQIAKLEFRIQQLESEAGESKFSSLATMALTTLLGVGAFFFTWLAITEYKENAERTARDIFSEKTVFMEASISGRVHSSIGFILARMTWDPANNYILRTEWDNSHTAISRLREACSEFQKCKKDEELYRRHVRQHHDSAKNNLAFYLSLSENASYAEEAAALAEELRLLKSPADFPLAYSLTAISVEIAFFEFIFNKAESATAKERLTHELIQLYMVNQDPKRKGPDRLGEIVRLWRNLGPK